MMFEYWIPQKKNMQLESGSGLLSLVQYITETIQLHPVKRNNTELLRYFGVKTQKFCSVCALGLHYNARKPSNIKQ